MIATLAAFLVGKAIEVVWNRVNMLLLLRRVSHHLAEGDSDCLVEPTKAAAQDDEIRSYDYPINSRDYDALHPSRIKQHKLPLRLERPKVVMRNAGDVNLAIRQLFREWGIPRLVIQTDEIPTSSLERTQDRLVRLSAVYTYQLAGWFAFVTFVVSMIYAMRPPKEVMLWTLSPDWRDFLVVVMLTAQSAVLGFACEVLWVRWKVVRVLITLRRQLSKKRRLQ